MIMTPQERQLLVDTANRLAEKHHAGQFRADGVTPYITHPETAKRLFTEMFMRMRPVPAGEEGETFLARGQALAKTHDIVEDTNVTFEYLEQQGLGPIILELKLLTKYEGDSYLGYLLALRASGNQLALLVKLADMDANLSDLDNIPSKGRRKSMKIKYELAKYVLTHP